MADSGWVCPWGICTHDQAQVCRADTRKGCGERFDRATTPDEARRKANMDSFMSHIHRNAALTVKAHALGVADAAKTGDQTRNEGGK